MRISQMTTDKAADVLIRITGPVANIMHDEAVLEFLKNASDAENITPLAFIADNVVSVATVLLKTHRDDLYEIISAMSGKTVKVIAKQSIIETVKDVKDCWDAELLDFFGLSKGQKNPTE